MFGLLLGFGMAAFTVMLTKAMGRNGSLLGSTDISQDILYQITSVVFICVSVLFLLILRHTITMTGLKRCAMTNT